VALHRTRVNAPDDKGDYVMKKMLKNKSGATAIEYGLIAALIAVVIIGAAQTLGKQISTTFGTVSTTMKNASA
jgi:pilus assembly protein Flp/PilA